MQCGFCGASSPGRQRATSWSSQVGALVLWKQDLTPVASCNLGHLLTPCIVTPGSAWTREFGSRWGHSSVQKQLSEQCHQIMHGLALDLRQKGRGSWDQMVAPKSALLPRLFESQTWCLEDRAVFQPQPPSARVGGYPSC